VARGLAGCRQGGLNVQLTDLDVHFRAAGKTSPAGKTVPVTAGIAVKVKSCG
jgi:hypothetical protein